MENDILKHRMAVIGNIEKSFGEDIVEKGFEDEVNPFEYAEWENSLTKAELDEFEKAKHQDGDMHPNGKWVWRQSANGGKGDWRVANPKRGGRRASNAAQSSENNNQQPTNQPSVSSSSSAAKQSSSKTTSSNSGLSDSKKTTSSADKTISSDNVNKLKLNGVDITVKRDPKDKYGYIVEGNGKSVKTQDPSFYNVTKLTGLTKKTIADMLDIPLKTTKKSDKPYIYNDGGTVGGKTQIKDEAGLLKVLNGAKSNTVLIYDKDWVGLNREAKRIGEKNGWKVTVDVDKEGNPSSTGSYIMFKKK